MRASMRFRRHFLSAFALIRHLPVRAGWAPDRRHLQENGLLGRTRIPIQPNIKGQLPTMINLNRAIPAPLRPQ
jgi:hypothetical protein